MNDDILGLDSDDSDDSDADDADLESRLEGVDLEAASYDDLWTALTPEERERFTKALRDPDSELAQQLLSSEELEKVRVEPWWEAPDDASAGPSSASFPAQKRYGEKPASMQVPANMAGASHTPGKFPLLLYNLCAIMVAYAYVTRYLATSPLTSLEPSERDEASRIISELVPFLTNRLSKTVHSTLSATVTDLLSRFRPGAMPLTFYSLVLRDAGALLRPSAVVELPPTAPSDSTAVINTSSIPPTNHSPVSPDLASHPSARTFLALSDLSALFSAGSTTPNPKPTSKRKHNHVTHKLTFYSAYVLGVPPRLLHTLAGEVAGRAEAMARESADGGGGAAQTTESIQESAVGAEANQTTRIVELT